MSTHIHPPLSHLMLTRRGSLRRREVARPTQSRAQRIVAPVTARARRAPFVVVVLGVIGTGLVGLILISTTMQSQAFELARLTNQARDLETQQEALQREVSDLESPEHLGPRALTLGMVPSSTPVYLELPDGKVRGTAKPAEAKTNLHEVIR